jgi:hypothetical protein
MREDDSVFSKKIRNKQCMIFFLSYFMHFMCEMGMTAELTTANFYKELEMEDDGLR